MGRSRVAVFGMLRAWHEVAPGRAAARAATLLVHTSPAGGRRLPGAARSCSCRKNPRSRRRARWICRRCPCATAISFGDCHRRIFPAVRLVQDALSTACFELRIQSRINAADIAFVHLIPVLRSERYRLDIPAGVVKMVAAGGVDAKPVRLGQKFLSLLVTLGDSGAKG